MHEAEAWRWAALSNFSAAATTWTFKAKPLFEALDLIHLLGFMDVELWAEGVHLDPRGEPPDLDELAAAMDRIGLAAHSIHAPFRGLDLTSPDPGVRNRAVSVLSRTIEMAGRLDCPYVVVHVDGAGERGAGGAPTQHSGAGGSGAETGGRDAFVDEAEAFERAAAALTVLCKHAQDHHVTILVENQPDPARRRFGASVADLLELIHMVGAPNIGICFDVPHAVVSTGGWEKELRAALPYVRSVHASDTEGGSDAHWPLGRGAIDWRRVLEVLEEAGYDGGFVLEVAGGEAALEESFAALQGASGAGARGDADAGARADTDAGADARGDAGARADADADADADRDDAPSSSLRSREAK